MQPPLPVPGRPASAIATVPTRRAWLAGGAAASLWLAAGRTAWANADPAPPEVQALWPQARLVGHGRLRYFGLSIYTVQLWAPAAPDPQAWWQSAFALALRYSRALQGEAIAQRSLQEMQRQASLPGQTQADWLLWMRAAFPNVTEGDRLCAVHRAQQPGLQLFFNGVARHSTPDADFARLFTGIWLSPQTSQPQLRAALLGLPA